jgi:MFS family permease
MNALRKPGEYTLLAVATLTIMVGCAIVPGLAQITPRLAMEGWSSWLVTMPAVGVVVLGPLAGRLCDRIGLRRALLIGLFLYGALGMAATAFRGPVAVLLDRFLLGGATALVMATGTGLISVFYDERRRLSMIARQGMAIELGGVVFLTIGGWLAALNWWQPFLLYLVAWAILAFVLLFIPDDRGQRDAALAASPHDRLPAAMRPVYVAACLSMTCFFSAVIVLPLRFHEMSVRETQTGYYLAFVSLVAVGVAGIMPRVARGIGAARTLTVAFASYAAAHAIFAVADSVFPFIGGGILLGAGFGLSVPLVNHMTVEASPANLRGRSLAYLSMAIFGGQCLPSSMRYEPGNAPHLFAAACAISVAAIVVLGMLGRKLAAATSQG